MRVTLSPFHGRLQASVRLPGVPVALWLNLDARVREGQNLPELDSLHVGQLPVPSWAATWAVRRAGLRMGLDIDPQIVRDVVQHVSLTHGVATVSYTWQADTHLRLMASLVPPSEQARLKAYSDHLVQLAGLEGSTGEDVLLPHAVQADQLGHVF